MYMPDGERTGAIFHSVQIVGMTGFALKQRKEKVFCDECENTKWISLDVKKIIAHLLGTKEDGSDVIGVYPLLPNGTCRFIVFDFDNHEKGAEVTDFCKYG